MEGGPSNLALVDLVDSLLLAFYALNNSDLMMQAPLCAILFLFFFDHGNFAKHHHHLHSQGMPEYTPYFLVVANTIIIHKLLDTNITLTCPPTLPYDKAVGFS
jgi:hypothetical protein